MDGKRPRRIWEPFSEGCSETLPQIRNNGVAMKLRHWPTGLEATGQIPSEHFSKTELVAAKELLRNKLWAELEGQVARELRIPGRTGSHR